MLPLLLQGKHPSVVVKMPPEKQPLKATGLPSVVSRQVAVLALAAAQEQAPVLTLAAVQAQVLRQVVAQELPAVQE